jgi:hypothetical protein
MAFRISKALRYSGRRVHQPVLFVPDRTLGAVFFNTSFSQSLSQFSILEPLRPRHASPGMWQRRGCDFLGFRDKLNSYSVVAAAIGGAFE